MLLAGVAVEALEGQHRQHDPATPGRRCWRAQRPHRQEGDGHRGGCDQGAPPAGRRWGRRRRGIRPERLDGGHEAVATLGHRLHEARRVRGIAEGLAQPAHGVVEAGVEVHERVGRPQALAQLLAGDHLAGAGQQQGQDAERLILEVDAQPGLAHLAGVEVDLEAAEPAASARRLHVGCPGSEVILSRVAGRAAAVSRRVARSSRSCAGW